MIDMLSSINILLALLLMIAGFFLFFRFSAVTRHESTLHAQAMVSVIIPVRNEAHRILPLLQSLKRQSYLNFEIIVVDDDSSDGTASVADRFGTTLIRIPEKPDGWIGKTHACWKGAQAASGDYLLFLDADVRLSPAALEILLHTIEKQPGIVSVQPYHSVSRWYEHFSLFPNLVVLAGVDAFNIMSKRGKTAGLFGPCILVDRNDYMESGGHKAIKNELVDDMAMGRLFQEKGFQIFCFGGGPHITYAMYPEGIASLVGGWTKNLSKASEMSGKASIVMLAAWITGIMSSFSFPVLIAFGCSPFFTAFFIVIFSLYGLQIFGMSRKAGNFHPICSFVYPVYILFFLFLFFRSIYVSKVKKEVVWKNRTIRLS